MYSTRDEFNVFEIKNSMYFGQFLGGLLGKHLHKENISSNSVYRIGAQL